MEYRNIGRTGLKVSEICFGTMTFGNYTDLAEGKRMVDMCFDAGVNFFDTADAYNGGKSEEILGEALKGKRDQAVLATKVFNPMGPGVNDSGWSRKHVLQDIEESLQRLQTDYIDIYYIHHVDIQTPVEEILETINDLVRQGKVRYAACSNFEAWRLMDALAISEARGWARVECYQPQYSLVVRDIEDELIPACQHKGVGVVVWAPLAGGLLTGKYKPGQSTRIEGTRSADAWCFPQGFFAANADEILTELLAVSEELGRSPAQVALRWALQMPGVTSVIAGARNREQLKDNLYAGSWQLDEASMQRLTEVSEPRVRYPKKMEMAMFDRRSDGVQLPSWLDPKS